MELDDERVNMMAHAAGRAVMELCLADIPDSGSYHRQAGAVP